MLKKIVTKKGGQTLLEVILSIGILAIVLTALAVLGMTTLKTSKSSLSRSEAIKLASAGIEATRYVRDKSGCGLDLFAEDIDSGSGTNPDGCYKISIPSGSVCGVLEPDLSCDGEEFNSGEQGTTDGQKFVRKIQVQKYKGKDPSEIVLVRSTVTWKESVGTKKVVLTNVLTSVE